MESVKQPQPQLRNSGYIEYVDVFAQKFVVPSAGERNFMFFFDTFDGRDALLPLTMPQCHKLYQMTCFYVLEGECTFEINGKSEVVKAGSLLSTMPENGLRFISSSADIQYFMLVIYPKLMSQVFSDLGITNTNGLASKNYFISQASEDQMNRILDLYKEMKRDMLDSPYEYKQMYQRSLLTALFVENMYIHQYNPRHQNGDSNSRQYDVYCRFLVELGKHVQEHRSVQYYSDALHISSKYLSFVCISYSNKNASTWIDEYVVQKIKVLMKVHGYSFNEIAEIMHFPTISSFCRYFKRCTGMTPKTYMNKQP